MNETNHTQNNGLPPNLKLKKLTLEQVRQIDEAIISVGDYGEVHLIVQRGKLRYINRVESFKAWKDEADN